MAVCARSSAVSRLGGGMDPTNLMDFEELVLSLWTRGAPALAPVVLADKGAPAAQALAFGGSGGAGWRPGGAAHAFAGGACVDVDASMASRRRHLDAIDASSRRSN